MMEFTFRMPQVLTKDVKREVSVKFYGIRFQKAAGFNYGCFWFM